jgi:hypothetical protein
MTEWTSECRHKVYEYIADCDFKKVKELAGKFKILKATDLSPTNKAAMKSMAEKIEKDDNLQIELLEMISDPNQPVRVIGKRISKNLNSLSPQAFCSFFLKFIDKILIQIEEGKRIRVKEINALMEELGINTFPTEELVYILPSKIRLIYNGYLRLVIKYPSEESIDIILKAPEIFKKQLDNENIKELENIRKNLPKKNINQTQKKTSWIKKDNDEIFKSLSIGELSKVTSIIRSDPNLKISQIKIINYKKK